MPSKRATAVAVLVLSAFALGAASRFVNVSRVDSSPTGAGPARTADVLVVGVVANVSGKGTAGRDYVRGIRLWQSRVREASGIQYNINQHAALRVIVRDDHGRPDEARKIARELLKQEVSVIFGPPDPDELTSVADTVDQSTSTLLFSPMPRPSTLPTMARATFLYRPPVGDLHAALDVVFLRPPRGASTHFKRRVVLLTAPGDWALRARSGQLLAQQRAFDAPLIKVRSADVDKALKRVRGPLDAIITVAPFRRALRWFVQTRRKSRTPWILVSADLATAVPIARPYTVAVTVPWSPTSIGGDSVFPSKDFPTTYEAVYGKEPSVDAAAGAALGALLNQIVVTARSTDPSRLLRARAHLNGGSFWGSSSLRGGEQPTFLPYVVLLDHGLPINIWPPPGKIKHLRLSIPPAATG
jgi:Periplasmic binding protein